MPELAPPPVRGRTPPSHAAYLPARWGTRHDPFRARLDAATGWRAAADQGAWSGLAEDRGALVLAAATDTLGDPAGSFGGLVLPATLALLPDCDLVLLDPTARRLRLLDPCACAFVEVPGRPAGVAPVAIAAAGRDLAVADPGAGAVVLLDGRSFAPRRRLVPPPSALPWQPVAVAAARGRIFVGDPTGGAVHVFLSDGRWTGRHTGLGAVAALATDRAGRVWIARGGEATALVLDAATGVTATVATTLDARQHFAPLPVRTRPDGSIDAGGLCAGGAGVFAPDGSALADPAPPAPASTAAGSLIAGPIDSRIARCQWDLVELDAATPSGCRITLETLTAEAERPFPLIASAEDSAWRPNLSLAPGHAGPASAPVRSDRGRYLWLRLRLTGPASASPRVCRIEPVYPRLGLARFLPAVMRADPAAADFTERFLGIFEEGHRSIERQIDNQAALFDPDTAPHSTRADRDMLGWLAGWIGVTLDRALPEQVRRTLLKAARLELGRVATPGALRRQLLALIGLDPLAAFPVRAACVPCRTPPSPPWEPPLIVLEHFRVRRWLIAGLGRLGADSVLWGERILNHARLDASATLGVAQLIEAQDPWRGPFHHDAHKFSVFLPAWMRCDPVLRRAATRLIEANRPAHAAFTIRWVGPAMRLGQQAMLGFDSVIGRRSGEPVALGEANLGKATVLIGGASAEAPPRLGTGFRLG